MKKIKVAFRQKRDKREIAEKQINEAFNILFAEVKKEISQEACEQDAKLIRPVELIYKPMTEAKYQQLQERCLETGKLKI